MSKLLRRIVAAAVILAIPLSLLAAVADAANVYTGNGWDVSYPQCGSSLPKNGDFAVVGVNKGIAWSANPCLASQLGWASGLSPDLSVYANLADPASSSYYECGVSCPYDYGAASAADAYRVVQNAGFDPSSMFWWLDVETANSWDGSAGQNLLAIQGYVAGLETQGVSADHIGIYSTPSQWTAITGTIGNDLSLPVWLAGAHAEKQANQYCDQSNSFTGGPVYLVQYFRKGYSADLACTSTSGDGHPGGGRHGR